MELSDWLESQGSKRATFAALLGVTTAAVNHWCAGRRVPRLSYMVPITEMSGGAVQAADFERVRLRHARTLGG